MNGGVRRRAVRSILTFVLLLASAIEVAAQDRPVVFVHGLASSAETWNQAASRLQQRLRITAYGASLNWRDWYENQGGALQAAAGSLPASTIAVGHSNGGIVSREWSRRRALGGVITLGTPHEGALLVARIFDILNLNLQMFNQVNILLDSLRNPNDEFHGMWAFLATSLSWASATASTSISGLAATLGMIEAAPVLGQMVPGSAYLSGLNSSGNLARERSAIARRVGLVFVAREYWKAGIAVALAPEWQDRTYESKQVAIVLFEGAAAYLQSAYPPFHYRAQMFAGLFRDAAHALRMADPYWCWAVTNDISCATSHDGVVATPAQYYPGGENFGYVGPAHVRETRDGEEAIFQALHGVFGVQARGATVPPPPPGGPGAGSLTAGQRLYPDQEIASPGGTYVLRYQSDGNLVLYRRNGPPVWHSATAGLPAGHLEMQGDGNLVIYNAYSQPVWASQTSGHAGAYLNVQDDGYIVIVGQGGTPLWWGGGQ